MLKVDEPFKSINPSSGESSNQHASAAQTGPNSNKANAQFAPINAEGQASSIEHSYPINIRQHELATAGVGSLFRDSADPPDDMLSTFHHSLPSQNPSGGYYSSEPLFQQHIPTNYHFGGHFQSTDDIPSSSLQLQIPDQPYPGLYTQDNNSSPWYGSDSPYSTPSDVSRTGRSWEYRPRSASVCTVPDVGYAPPTAPWSPDQRASSGHRQHSIHSRSSAFGNISEQGEEALYLSAAPQVGYEVSGSVS